MGSVIGDLLPVGVGVAISPVPIIAAILMLLGTHARTTSIGFALGWLVGIVAATVIFVFVGSAIDTSDGPSKAASWIKVVLGVLLLLLGIHSWRTRNADKPPPKWMNAIDEMKAPTGVGLGFALAAVNPKNLMLCVSAGVSIGTGGLSSGQEVIGVAVFALLGSVTVAGPVLAYQLAAQRLSTPLQELKQWLQDNNQTVMAILFLMLGVSLLGKGIGGF